MIFDIHIYQVKTVCHVHEWLLPLAVLLSYLPPINLTGEVCVLNSVELARYQTIVC